MTIPIRQLGDVAERIFVGMPTKASETIDGGRPGNVLTVRALTGTGVDPSQLTEVDLGGKDVDRYRVVAGDVLVSARSTSLRTAVVPKGLEGVIINATVLGIRCSEALEPRLLVAYLESSEGRAALEAVAQSATAQMNVTVAGISKILVPIPPKDLQRRYAAILESADEAYDAAVRAAEIRRHLATEIVVDSLKTERAR